MISDVKLQHAGVYVCRATTPGTRNFTVAMATLTVLGMFYFILHSGESCILTLVVLSHSLLTYAFLGFCSIDMKVDMKYCNPTMNFRRKLKPWVKM